MTGQTPLPSQSPPPNAISNGSNQPPPPAPTAAPAPAPAPAPPRTQVKTTPECKGGMPVEFKSDFAAVFSPCCISTVVQRDPRPCAGYGDGSLTEAGSATSVLAWVGAEAERGMFVLNWMMCILLLWGFEIQHTIDNTHKWILVPCIMPAAVTAAAAAVQPDAF